MGFLRTAQPSTLVMPGFNVQAYGTSTAMPIGISKDRKTVYGSAVGMGTTLYQSTNDGASWTSVHVFAESVTGIQETDDGECIVTTDFTPKVYKSTGWATSHTTATWTQVLATPGGSPRPQWGGGHTWTFGNDLIRANTSKYGVINEYGSATSAGLMTARRAWWSEDYGTTWTQVFDLQARYPGVAGLHVHATAYDPYWDRIWLTFGDAANPDGPGNSKLLYSDDHGATWTPVPIPAEFGSTNTMQWVTIAVLKTGIFLGPDPHHGWFRLARRGYRKMGALTLFASMTSGSNAQILPWGAHQNRNQAGAPFFAASVSSAAYCTGPVFISLDDGGTFTQFWEDPLLRGSNKGCIWAIGPTYSGKLLVWTSQSGGDPGAGTHWMARGEMVVPEPGLLDVQKLCTGDGTTTVFNYAHGLGYKPSRVMGWPEKVGPLTVTADATNIIITFTTAPANAAVIPVQLRYAA